MITTQLRKILFIFITSIITVNATVPTFITDASLGILPQKSEPQYCFFTPPPGWIPKADIDSKSVLIEFLTKGEKELAPSINLAVEKINVSPKEYLKAVQSIHTANKNSTWRDLGKIKTLAGEAFLTEIDTVNQHGPIRQLQLILVKGPHAYILTACALKDEFATHYATFRKTFESLTLTTNLLTHLKDNSKRETIVKMRSLMQDFIKDKDSNQVFASEEFRSTFWLPLQNFVINDCKEMGAHWQILVLKDSKESLADAR